MYQYLQRNNDNHYFITYDIKLLLGVRGEPVKGMKTVVASLKNPLVTLTHDLIPSNKSFRSQYESNIISHYPNLLPRRGSSLSGCTCRTKSKTEYKLHS